MFQIGDIVYIPSQDVGGTVVGLGRACDNVVIIDTFNGYRGWRCSRGHVVLTYRESPTDYGALEYEEIMKIQEIEI